MYSTRRKDKSFFVLYGHASSTKMKKKGMIVNSKSIFRLSHTMFFFLINRNIMFPICICTSENE